eukprot:2875128-Pyramimonas_sp.AAC.1
MPLGWHSHLHILAVFASYRSHSGGLGPHAAGDFHAHSPTPGETTITIARYGFGHESSHGFNKATVFSSRTGIISALRATRHYAVRSDN